MALLTLAVSEQEEETYPSSTCPIGHLLTYLLLEVCIICKTASLAMQLGLLFAK